MELNYGLKIYLKVCMVVVILNKTGDQNVITECNYDLKAMLLKIMKF